MEERVISPHNRALQRFVHTQKDSVPYVRQIRSWDCGIACVAMALKAQGVEELSLEELMKRCGVEATWTIDIAYLLNDYGVNCLYYTVTRGVRPEYLSQAFYKEMHDARGTNRVIERFENAETFGITVIEEKLSIIDIQKAIVERGQIAIVLVDKRLLRCSLCAGYKSTTDAFRSRLRKLDGFLGHFVLLHAYHDESSHFLMKDPASGEDYCIVSASNLDLSRLAYGTDEDVIFVQKANVPRLTESSSPPLHSQGNRATAQPKTPPNGYTANSQVRLEDGSLILRSDSSPSSTVGREIFNFMLRKVFGVSIPRTKAP